MISVKNFSRVSFSAFLTGAVLFTHSAYARDVAIPVSRSQLYSFKSEMAEVIVADPEIADVHAHGTNQLTIIGKSMGQTNVRVIGKDGKLIETYNVTVSYDLPAIRKAIKQFISDENIGVDVVNNKVALTGKVSSASVADRAIKIAETFVVKQDPENAGLPIGKETSGNEKEELVLNFMQIASSQQVMLHVRVGELKRDALKQIGLDWSTFGTHENFVYQLGIGSGVERFLSTSAGAYTIDKSSATRGYTRFGWRTNSQAVDTLIKSLERDGVFKLLAEPNLVAISGEEAQFLAGGEVPIPVPQPSSGLATVQIEYKPFGVAVKFKPYVLTPNRLRIEVNPEVSELDYTNALTISGFSVPAFTTRRAKTVLELAPGESFMIAGLVKDEVRTTIDQLPGVKELPVLGALFRSTDFQRNETELVIAVTPYLVDPVRNSDIKLPTDNYVAPTQMDMLFYGNISGNKNPYSSPALEGPAGFMTE